jgi:hypothetical protein
MQMVSSTSGHTLAVSMGGSVMKGVRMGWSILASAMAAAIMTACSSTGDSGSGLAPVSCELKVDRFKELMIVEPTVINDDRTLNAKDGVWSFRHAVEEMKPTGVSETEFVLSWFHNWVTTTQVNGFDTDQRFETRSIPMEDLIVCPWLKRTAGNGCDDSCSTCAKRELDLAQAPFRLVAIVNRQDLGGRPDIASPAGEARLVFALTYGAADDPSSKAGPMSMIFEYSVPKSIPAKDWAERWHALGKEPAFDESFKLSLANVTEAFVRRGASPERPNGSAIAQVRTNESALNWIWQLRQFQLDVSGNLRLVPVSNTPGKPLNNSPQLKEWVLANKDAIMADKHVLPTSMLAGAADQFVDRWSLPSVDENLRATFARGTCNGCHSGENPPIDTAFHVSPYRQGVEKLSTFLHNPSNPKGDELSKRELHFRQVLCN